MEKLHYMETLKLLDSVITIVELANPFIIQPSNIQNHYNLLEYIKASSFTDVKLMVLVDNNILTRVIPIVKGKKISRNDESTKLACAIMYFFIRGNFTIEPSMAIYERASKSSHDDVVSDLFDFRVADNLNPQLYAELACDIINKVSLEEINLVRSKLDTNSGLFPRENLAKAKEQWKIQYLFILKAAELWKKFNGKVDATKEFIEWMENDAFFNPVASIFVFIIFSPKRTKMIKGINSTNKTKFRDDLRNEAWDLAYIDKWSRYSKRANSETIWFLCSNDKVMKQVASTILIKQDVSVHKAISDLLVLYWGKKDGMYLSKVYLEVYKRITQDEAKRDSLIHERFSKVNEMIINLEDSLGIKT